MDSPDSFSEVNMFKFKFELSNLEKWQDFMPWYLELKAFAKHAHVWRYIDPSKTDDLPEAPRKPEPIANDASEEEKACYEEHMIFYRLRMIEWRRDASGLEEIRSAIAASVDKKYSACFENTDGLKGQVRAIKRRLTPSAVVINTDLLNNYNALLEKPTGSFDDYLNRWLNLADRASYYALDHDGVRAPWQSEQMACVSMNNAIAQHSAFAIRAEFCNTCIEGKPYKECSIEAQAKSWRDYLYAQRIDSFPSSSRPKEGGSGSKKPGCVCGNHHRLVDCWYLNPFKPRRANWTPNRRVRDKVDSRLKTDENLRMRQAQMLAKYKEYHPDHQRQDAGEYKQTEPPKLSGSLSSGALVVNASDVDGSSPVRRCAIFDTSSPVHIANSLMKDANRLSNFREPAADQIIFAGSWREPLRPTHICDMLLMVNDGKGGTGLVVMADVWYVPDYLASVFSYLTAKSKGIRANLDDSCLYAYREDKQVPVAYWEQRYRQLVLEELKA